MPQNRCSRRASSPGSWRTTSTRRRDDSTRGSWSSIGSPRETEVLALVGKGLSNDEIAAHLHLAVKTVKHHISHLLAKTASRDRAQLVITAYDTGLVRPRPGATRP
jgi:DNA-binding NarL/FixJ family response regulator